MEENAGHANARRNLPNGSQAAIRQRKQTNFRRTFKIFD